MYGNMGNMAGMMKKVQKLQADMAKFQEEFKTRSFEITAGGGVITVIISGDKSLKSIKISPTAVDPEDVEMLEDLITAAVNEAIKMVDDTMSQEMDKLTGGMNLPKGMF